MLPLQCSIDTVYINWLFCTTFDDRVLKIIPNIIIKYHTRSPLTGLVKAREHVIYSLDNRHSAAASRQYQLLGTLTCRTKSQPPASPSLVFNLTSSPYNVPNAIYPCFALQPI